MKMNTFRKAALILAASLAIGCKLPDYHQERTENQITGLSGKDMALIKQYKSGNVPVRNDKDSFIIEWDNGSQNIDVKYRQRFTDNWLPLGISETNQFLVSGLEPGIYEFAVYDRNLGVTHTSLDKYAQPVSGWFLMNKCLPEADSNLDGKISDAEMELFIGGWIKRKFTDQQFSINSDFYVSQK